MSTGNTTISAGSSTQTVPEGLQRLTDCSEELPYLRFTVDQLDEIADGNNTDDLKSLLADGTYIKQMLPAIDWWISVATALMFGRSVDGELRDPAFEEQRKELISLLNPVLFSYPAALAETPYYMGSNLGTPYDEYAVCLGLAFMKRYRLYTRYVCAFAQEVWPDVDLGWLLKQA